MDSKVHRVRFYNPIPQHINCVSFNKKTKLLALTRGDSSIEIWNLNRSPYLERFIPVDGSGLLEAIGWVHDRLLSTGLAGTLVEWDTAKLCRKNTVLLTGYAAWCLDVNVTNTKVAVGTEQGYINLYSVENDDIVYNKLFDKQDGRIMCCKFDNSGNNLVTGSVDTIRVWNVETGHATIRMSVSRHKKEVIVWSLAVLSDNTIVSGDSQGRLTFWDSSIGEQIESYVTQKADVLSIAISEDENSIFCSGVDPTISHFLKVTKTSDQKSGAWVKNVPRHIHEHDVRALVMNEDKLISVGVDGYLTFSSYPPKWTMRLPPMIPAPRSSLCQRKKLLLLRYMDHLEVWRLGSYANKRDDVISTVNFERNHIKNNNVRDQDRPIGNDVNTVQKKCLNLTEHPMKMVSIRSKKNKQIQCCELSPNGEFIVYTTQAHVRMLKLETDDTDEDQPNVLLSKVQINGLAPSSDRVAFTEDSRTLIVHNESGLQVLQVDPEAGAAVVQTIDIHKYLKTSSLLHLQVSKRTSSGATYIVVADSCSAIAVLVNKKNKYGHHVTLPKYKYVPSAMTVDCERETLVVVYVDQVVVEYDLSKKRFTEWPGSSLPGQWYARKSAVLDVMVHPRRNALIFQDETSLTILERDTWVEQDEPEVKKKPKNRKPLRYNIIPIKYCAGFHWIGEDEAVLLEILPENIVSQLPPPVQVNNWHLRP